MSNDAELRAAQLRLAEEILADGRIEAAEVLRLRREVFADGVVDRAEADLLFRLDAGSAGNAPEWTGFFVEALTDHFLNGREPKGVLTTEDGAYLADRITRDGRIDRRTEFELLVSIAVEAIEVPAEVIELIMAAVKETVLAGGGKLFGPERRRAGVIDDADVDILERVLYGTGGDGGFTVSRAEAELLFDLNDATSGQRNSPRWRDFFSRAVGNYLMFPSGSSPAMTGAARRRRAEWLDSPTGGHFAEAAGMLFRKGVVGVMRRRTPPVSDRLEADGEAERRMKVDAGEVSWLVERIGRDGTLDETEEALLAYVREKATEIDPSLRPLLDAL